MRRCDRRGNMSPALDFLHPPWWYAVHLLIDVITRPKNIIFFTKSPYPSSAPEHLTHVYPPMDANELARHKKQHELGGKTTKTSFLRAFFNKICLLEINNVRVGVQKPPHRGKAR